VCYITYTGFFIEGNIMKQTVLTLAVLATLGLGACSSTKVADVGSGSAVPAGTQQTISEQRLQNDFKRQGVRVIYTLTGELEAIESTGYAAVWGNSQNAAREAYRVAELEAKKSLNDFINQETIASTKSVVMISKNLEQARDNKTNKIATNKNRDLVAGTADEGIADKQAEDEINREENTAVRNDALRIASTVKTNITINNRGILGGLYLVEGEVFNDGKNVRVVYRWDKKHNTVRQQLRNLMAQ
jgi:tRNA(Leu) C34 or U34 (ribose-2'-O)-methylase TrmL